MSKKLFKLFFIYSLFITTFLYSMKKNAKDSDVESDSETVSDCEDVRLDILDNRYSYNVILTNGADCTVNVERQVVISLEHIQKLGIVDACINGKQLMLKLKSASKKELKLLKQCLEDFYKIVYDSCTNEGCVNSNINIFLDKISEKLNNLTLNNKSEIKNLTYIILHVIETYQNMHFGRIKVSKHQILEYLEQQSRQCPLSVKNVCCTTAAIPLIPLVTYLLFYYGQDCSNGETPACILTPFLGLFWVLSMIYILVVATKYNYKVNNNKTMKNVWNKQLILP